MISQPDTGRGSHKKIDVRGDPLHKELNNKIHWIRSDSLIRVGGLVAYRSLVMKCIVG